MGESEHLVPRWVLHIPEGYEREVKGGNVLSLSNGKHEAFFTRSDTGFYEAGIRYAAGDGQWWAGRGFTPLRWLALCQAVGAPEWLKFAPTVEWFEGAAEHGLDHVVWMRRDATTWQTEPVKVRLSTFGRSQHLVYEDPSCHVPQAVRSNDGTWFGPCLQSSVNVILQPCGSQE